jgi:hypothetical protein
MLGSKVIVDLAACASIRSATALLPGSSAVAMDPVCSTTNGADRSPIRPLIVDLDFIEDKRR